MTLLKFINENQTLLFSVKSNKDDVYQEVNGNTTNQATRGYGAISRSRSVTLSPDPAILAKPNFNRQKSWVAKRWSGIDNTLLKPMLTHAQPTLLETMPWCNKTILNPIRDDESTSTSRTRILIVT